MDSKRQDKTPIQQLIFEYNKIIRETEYLDQNEKEITRAIIGSFYRFLKDEKQFAKDCFNAGKKLGFDALMSIELGDKPTQPDFNNYFKRYER